MSEQEDALSFFKKMTGQEELTNTPETEAEPSDDDAPYPLPQLRPDRYVAFRLGKRRERLLIACAAAPMRFPVYHELRDISFDQAHQQGFYLFFHAMTVEVMVKNLWPVLHAISSGRCDAMYEHAKFYPARPAKGEPLIEIIRLSRRRRSPRELIRRAAAGFALHYDGGSFRDLLSR